MNIKRAKEEIEHTVKAYLAKDALGEYAIPAIRQRPILLMGPPGIGKTQVMEQVARECGVALVAYTITHHTRQSAVGLPFIRQRHYGDKDVSVTEYTMSEIIASIYAKMEATGLSEGILFIDEINCVSETLAPTMLQFLGLLRFPRLLCTTKGIQHLSGVETGGPQHLRQPQPAQQRVGCRLRREQAGLPGHRLSSRKCHSRMLPAMPAFRLSTRSVIGMRTVLLQAAMVSSVRP